VKFSDYPATVDQKEAAGVDQLPRIRVGPTLAERGYFWLSAGARKWREKPRQPG